MSEHESDSNIHQDKATDKFRGSLPDPELVRGANHYTRTAAKWRWLGRWIPIRLRSVRSLLLIQILIAFIIVVWIRPVWDQKQQEDRRHSYARLRTLTAEIRQHCKGSEYKHTFYGRQVIKSSQPLSWRVAVISSNTPMLKSEWSGVLNMAASARNAANVQEAFSGLTGLYSSPHCPASVGTDKTAFVLVVDSDTVVRKDKILDLQDIPDGGNDTGMLIELTNSDIDWWEPRDLTIDEAIQVIQTSDSTTGLRVAMASGRVVSVPQATPAAEIRKLFAIDDGIPQINYIQLW
ncbi:MAG: hypothetical protein JNL67_22060 [Planctomycetaceae bacterium]|nr:hypothetical protein [Planctomycetaceae bacterium]